MDSVNGEYSSVKFTDTEGVPSLRFGEFKVDRMECTVYIGRGPFPEDVESTEDGDVDG